jgi:hypothetical protein
MKENLMMKVDFKFDEESLELARGLLFRAENSTYCFIPEGTIILVVNGIGVKSWEEIPVIDYAVQLRTGINDLQPGQTRTLRFMDSSPDIRLFRKTENLIEVSDLDRFTCEFEALRLAINEFCLHLYDVLCKILPNAISGQGYHLEPGLVGHY